jgi:pimeloyl-ACP methyl ester carboxylesterase
MAHGWAAVKEMNLDYFASAMVDAGVAVVVFDHRGLGASEGLRGDIDPEQQIADYREALTFIAGTDGVDPERLAVWGTSYSGGHALRLAAQDTRVRAAVAQVPTISGSESLRRRIGEDGLQQRWAAWERERANIAAGHPPQLVPAAAVGGRDLNAGTECSEPVAPQLLPPAPCVTCSDADRWRYYAELPEERRRTWRNRVTALSFERYARFEPGRSLPHVSVPLLVIWATEDTVTPSDLIRAALGRTGDQVVSLPVGGGHYGVYTIHREHVARAAAGFLAQRLT